MLDRSGKSALFSASAIAVVSAFVASLIPLSATAAFWDDLWKTPHQQDLAQAQQEEFESLTENASTPAWAGVGHYRMEDYSQAAINFASSEDPSAKYNQATALTRAGEYEQAINLFDEILLDNPSDEKAEHNRSIAEQLAQLQQQQQQQQDGESEDGEKQEGEQQDGEQSDADQQPGEEQNPEQQDQDSQSQDSQDQNQQSDQQESAQSQETESAEDNEEQLADEQTEESASEEEKSPSESATLQEIPESMTEDQQATEQWLRRIPDDPSGLLRRKLQRSHSTDFPGVGDAASPW